VGQKRGWSDTWPMMNWKKKRVSRGRGRREGRACRRYSARAEREREREREGVGGREGGKEKLCAKENEHGGRDMGNVGSLRRTRKG